MFKLANKNEKNTDVGTLYENIDNAVRHNHSLMTEDDASSAFSVSMESLQSDQPRLARMTTSVNSINAMISQSLQGIQGFQNRTASQENAAITAFAVGTAPRKFLEKGIADYSEVSKVASAETFVFQAPAGSLTKRQFGIEAFDLQQNKEVLQASVVYNFLASRQDEFGELFFPTVVISPDQVGYNINVRLVETVNDVRRDKSGTITEYDYKNIVRAAIDPTILRNNITRVYPVLRTDSEDVLAKELKTTVLVGSEPVVTAPLLLNAPRKIDLLGISQTDVQLSTRTRDITDALDSSVTMSDMYIKMKDGSVIKYNTMNLATSSFNYSVQGSNVRLLRLAFSSNSLPVTSITTGVDGVLLPVSASLGTNTVRLSVSVFGTINQEQGDCELTTGAVSVDSVRDADGNKLDLTTGAGKTIVAAFKDATAYAVELYAHVTNSNRAQRGTLIRYRYADYLYTVPVLSPITSLRPITYSDSADASIIADLAFTTQRRASNDAVSKLLEVRQTLKQYCLLSNDSDNVPELFGAARNLVKPSYLEAHLDALTALDSLTSASRSDDVVGLLVNAIRDMAYRLYQKSGYQAPWEMLGTPGEKPTVLIGCDPTIYRYLTITGDTRTLGDAFKFKIVSTVNQEMTGKIVISFGKEVSDGVPNVMHFGNMAWSSEIVMMLPMVRNGANPMELTVQPRYIHVSNLPILGYIEVSNIEDVIASSKVTIDVQNTPKAP